MKILGWCLLIIGGYLLGSVMFCELIPKKLLHKDICAVSADNNPGAFNVFKHCGKKVGIPCLLSDISKGFIPVLIASLFFDTSNVMFSLTMIAPSLGHAVGLFNRFHGGKCIAVSFGIMLGLVPVTWIGIVTLAAFYVLFSTVFKIDSASKRSIIVYALFAAIVCTVLGDSGMAYVAIGCGIVAFIPIVKFLLSENGMSENKFRTANTEFNDNAGHGRSI